MRKALPSEFFDRPTLKVAEELLGKYLVRRYRGRERAAMITEVEAYDGPRDKASHASRGRTERNKVMFGESGVWYPYFTYGMHWLVNIVTGPKEYPAAILIRGVEGIKGPARVTKHFKIDGKVYGKPADKKTGLWFEDRGTRIRKKDIKKGPRVGVDYAGPVWRAKDYNLKVTDGGVSRRA
ncbi:DNA-3-methyladenine glycosylase [Patescibacteria group bacterium]|nr:DNA-3-methyladenine glycosylase [Patescibacteria group bacterium]